MKDDKYFSTMEEFIKTTTARKMILTALKEIKPVKSNWIGFLLSIILAIIFGAKIGISSNTVPILLEVTGIILNIVLAIFGSMFAVYSILLAFLNDSYIKRLSKIAYKNGDNDDSISFLKVSTTYYESILFLYFIALSITLIILLFLNCIKPNFTLTSNLILNNILATISISLYFTFIFRVIYELKSTIYNTIVLFRASIAYKILDFSCEEKEGDSDDSNK